MRDFDDRHEMLLIRLFDITNWQWRSCKFRSSIRWIFLIYFLYLTLKLNSIWQINNALINGVFFRLWSYLMEIPEEKTLLNDFLLLRISAISPSADFLRFVHLHKMQRIRLCIFLHKKELARYSKSQNFVVAKFSSWNNKNMKISEEKKMQQLYFDSQRMSHRFLHILFSFLNDFAKKFALN